MIELILIPIMSILNRFAGGGMFIGPLWNTGGIPKTMWNYELFKNILDKFGMDKLPGRAFYVAVILLFLSTLIFYSPVFAFLIAFTFGFWRSWAWGLFITMGNHVPDRNFTKYEEFLLRITGDSYFWGFFLRHLFMLPGFVLFSLYLGSMLPILLGVVLAMMITLSYQLAWKFIDIENGPVGYAEIMAGILFGITFVLLGTI